MRFMLPACQINRTRPVESPLVPTPPRQPQPLVSIALACSGTHSTPGIKALRPSLITVRYKAGKQENWGIIGEL